MRVTQGVFVVVAVFAVATGYCERTVDKPVHTAAIRGDLVAVQRLIAERKCMNEKGLFGRTPLHYATSSASPKGEMVAFFLITFGAELTCDRLKMSPLHYAAGSGQLHVVKLLVPRLGANSKGAAGATPLHFAVRSRHGLDKNRVAMVKFLLSEGADVNARDDNGKTPLHYAAECPMDDEGEIISLLLKSGADPKSKDKKGYYPADLARLMGTIRILIAEMDPSLPKLSACVRSGRVDWVEKRLELHPAELYERSGTGLTTPLHVAVLNLPADNGGPEVLQALLEAGAKNPSNKRGHVQDKGGRTPADWAFGVRWPLPLLAEYGFTPTSRRVLSHPPHKHTSQCRH